MDDEINCTECEYYDPEEGYCTAFVCDGIDCPTLPCEKEDKKRID